MAAKGLLKFKNQLFSVKISFVSEQSTHLCRPLLCYQQVRWGRLQPRAKNTPCPWLVRKKATPYMQNVTEENREFLSEAVLHHYNNIQPSPLRDGPWARNKWNIDTRRTGLLGVKIGVVPQWKRDGTKILCQLIQIVDNHVIRYTPPEEFQKSSGFHPGYRKNVGSVVVGAMSCNPWNYSKAYHNLFVEAGVPPKRRLTRFFVTPDAAIQPGTPLNAMHFKVGDYVDVSSKTIDHGFQGVVKRWGFAGGPASHGATKFHRRPGTIASGKKRGLFKGRAMAGHMGDDWRITKCLKIWRINTKYNVLYTSTGVPGPNHCYVRIYDTVNYNRRQEYINSKREISMPTFFADDIQEPVPEDIYHPDLFPMSESSIKFAEEGES